ncbi:hypothetical protein [Acinetobacter haemolyticus]|uniref:hypothetical protein n=1 Tax=Acinetobacter haemolyticus TaxID=29430 RepID=UPI0024DECD45|nr:hypothetical protein [Acinetobacter haemolyticus]
MKKIDISSFATFVIPSQKMRVSILAIIAVVVASWCLVLPPEPMDPLIIDTPIERKIIANTEVANSSIMVEQSGSVFNYWNLPIYKKEVVRKPKIIEPKIIQQKVETISPPYDAAPIPVPLPPIQYMGQVMNEKQEVSVFLKVGEENLILLPNVPYNSTWMILEDGPNQVVVQHIPDQQIISISK